MSEEFKKLNIDINSIQTPYYVVDRRLIERNLKVLDDVQKKTRCKILLALKGFSMYSLFPQIGRYLYGVTSSSLNEARLGYEEMGKEVHIYSPAYQQKEFKQILNVCDHIVFNSFAQYEKYKKQVKNVDYKNIECGIRINPEYSDIRQHSIRRHLRLHQLMDQHYHSFPSRSGSLRLRRTRR